MGDLSYLRLLSIVVFATSVLLVALTIFQIRAPERFRSAHSKQKR